MNFTATQKPTSSRRTSGSSAARLRGIMGDGFHMAMAAESHARYRSRWIPTNVGMTIMFLEMS